MSLRNRLHIMSTDPMLHSSYGDWRYMLGVTVLALSGFFYFDTSLWRYIGLVVAILYISFIYDAYQNAKNVEKWKAEDEKRRREEEIEAAYFAGFGDGALAETVSDTKWSAYRSSLSADELQRQLTEIEHERFMPPPLPRS